MAPTRMELVGQPIKKCLVKGTRERSRSQRDGRTTFTGVFISKTERPLTDKTEGFGRAKE